MLGECQRRPVDHSPLTEFLILVKTIAGSFNKRTVTGIPKSVHGEGLDSALRSCFLSSQSPRRGWVPRKERRWSIRPAGCLNTLIIWQLSLAGHVSLGILMKC